MEFCPRCNNPLTSTDDPARLCTLCDWFGDQSETRPQPGRVDQCEILRALLQKFGTMSQQYAIAEYAYDTGKISQETFDRMTVWYEDTITSIVSWFRKLTLGETS